MVLLHARGWKIGKAGICIQELRKTVGTRAGLVFFSGDPVEGGRDWGHSELRDACACSSWWAKLAAGGHAAVVADLWKLAVFRACGATLAKPEGPTAKWEN